MRFRSAAAAALAAGACALASPALAGVYTDDLAKCIVAKATPKDQRDLVFWVFTAISQHPTIKAYTTLTAAQREESGRTAGLLMQRLLTEDCRKEAVTALKYEGISALESSFSLLGQVAMRGLFSDPEVDKNMASLGSALDEARFEALFKEAGIQVGK